MKSKKARDSIRTVKDYGSAASVGVSLLKKKTRGLTSKDTKTTKLPNLIIDLEDENEKRTKKSPNKQSDDEGSPSTYRLSSTPKSLGAIQNVVFGEHPIDSMTGSDFLSLRPVQRRRVENGSPSSKNSPSKDGYSKTSVVYNFEEIMSIQGDESDQSQSASPSPSCSNSSSKHAKHLHLPFTRAEDSGSAFLSKEGTVASVSEYSDDFESSSDNEADERLTRLSNTSQREHDAVRRGVKLGASSSTIGTSSLVQSPPLSQYGGTGSIEGVKKPKKRVKAIKTIDESRFHTSQKVGRAERRISRSVGVMTDEPRQFPTHHRKDYYDQNAFVAAVTAATEHIIAERSGPRPFLPHPLGTRRAIDALTYHSPCLVALDNALREQLKITQTFLSTQRAMHDALKGALHKCLVPHLEPIDLHFNYTLRTQKEL
ncbi:hypothetical protein TcWFU_006429 [Taenia crassiceps]|uniref:DUF4614 domain-containing protein n=1 Tax=Taenia crassiceps TaxID=6207 RepID=A0ABR4QEY4_9CEST